MAQEEQFGYQGGRPVWYIVLILALWALIILGYGSQKWWPDISNWMKGGNPDKIQWSIEAPGK